MGRRLVCSRHYTDGNLDSVSCEPLFRSDAQRLIRTRRPDDSGQGWRVWWFPDGFVQIALGDEVPS